MIGIIDYGMGNLLSVKNAIDYLGYDADIVSDPNLIPNYEKLILPGVGAFPDCMAQLHKGGFVQKLNQHALDIKKPILGICLGMQVMSNKGYEGSETNGLGWFDADVELMVPGNKTFRIPHVGWNETDCENHDLFSNIKNTPEFYYVHSYSMRCKNKSDVIATFNHGGTYTAAVAKHNIIGCQFHPEKSQEHGLIVLGNFITKSFL